MDPENLITVSFRRGPSAAWADEETVTDANSSQEENAINNGSDIAVSYPRSLSAALFCAEGVNDIPPSNRRIVDSLIEMLHVGYSRRDASDRIRRGQARLASQGFSTGGSPPYGSERWLFNSSGERIRRLADGERVIQAGYHVRKLPTNNEELRVVERIQTMSRTMSAKSIATKLNEEGVAAPGSTENVRKAWSQRSVTRIICQGTR